MQDNFKLDNAIKETSSFVRDKADVAMYSTARKTSDLSASLIMKGIYAVIIFLIFILLNIAACFVLKHIFYISYLESALYEAAFYTLILIILFIFNPCISRAISRKIARELISKIDEINKGLDEISPEIIKREVPEVSQEPTTKKKEKRKSILDLEKEATKKLGKSQKRFKQNINYVKKNFKTIALDIAKDKVMLALYKNRYIAPLMDIMGIDPESKRIANNRDTGKNTRLINSPTKGNNTKNWLSVATTIGTSLFWSFAVTKTKNMIIGKLFPRKATQKKKKTIFTRIKTLF